MHVMRPSLIVVIVAGLTNASPVFSSYGSQFRWEDTKYLLAFGDSYTYVQGTHGHQNYSFIADQLNYSFTAEALLSDLIVQNQTATAEGGPNWVEFLTGCGLKPGLTSPLTCERQLWDFAFAGADISVEYTPLHHDYTVSFVNQITQYETYAYPVLQDTVDASMTLVAIWIGINDINDSAKYAVDFPSFYDQLHSTLFASVEKLYALGYRSYLFMNLPPLDRTPSNQKRGPNPSPNATQVAWFNDALSTHASSFVSAHDDVSALVFDAHATLSDVMDGPSNYGIVNTTDFCAGFDQPDVGSEYAKYGCPTPLSTYFWFNSGHLTSRVHEILAGAVREALNAWT